MGASTLARLALGIALLFADGVLFSHTEAAEDVIRLRIADSFPPGHYIATSLPKFFMDKVVELTGGKVQFDYFPAQQFGKLQDYLTLTQSGALDIAYFVPALNADKAPHLGVAELPNLFQTSCAGTEAFMKLSSPGGLLAKLDYEPNGVRFIMGVMNMPQAIFTTNKVVNSPEDAKGLKIRTPGGATDLTIRSFGAVPVRIAPPDIYQSLARGTVDGTDMNFTGTKAYDLQGHLHHVTSGITFGSGANAFLMSLNRWKQLPPAVQEAIEKAGLMASRNSCKYLESLEDGNRAELAKIGVAPTIIDEQYKSAWRDRLASATASWVEQFDKRDRSGSELLKAFTAAIPQ